MKQTLLFVPTLRETPKEAEAISNQILLKGGYIKQVAAGIYSYLPLSYRVIKKIEKIVREEMDAIGASELLMPTMQPKDLWVESGRWDAYGKELMRLADRHDRDFCLGPTHEEVITSVVRDYINSYKKMPLALYQIQTKFRDEFRPRFGLMRGREFIMKDLYTFHTSEEDLDVWYKKVRQAYQNILDRLELKYRIVNASSGNIGGTSSEEFMILCDIGEDTIVYSDESEYASNTELVDLPVGAPSPDGKGHILHAKGIEAGHIFKLGTKYSLPMKAMFLDQNQKQQPIIMGCYGMGISRLLMAVLEQHYQNGIALWPDEIAPFKIHIIPMDREGSTSHAMGLKLHDELSKQFEVLFDDREERAGVKFKDADLIGVNYRIVSGRKAAEGIFELHDLRAKTQIEISFEDLLKFKF